MLFRKKIARSCEYCYFRTSADSETITCEKRGKVTTAGGCMRFRYDPCKRIPPKPKALDFKKYDDADFSL